MESQPQNRTLHIPVWEHEYKREYKWLSAAIETTYTTEANLAGVPVAVNQKKKET